MYLPIFSNAEINKKEGKKEGRRKKKSQKLIFWGGREEVLQEILLKAE